MSGRIVISYDKGQYFVTHFGSNGRKLNHTETFTQKPSAWVNIKATAKDFGKKASIIVQDDSLISGPALYLIMGTGKIYSEPNGVKVKKHSLKGIKVKSRKHPLKGRARSW